jgi:hypothetical protein
MTKRKNIIQPPEVWAAWSKIAEAKGWTMAHLIFEAVNHRHRLNQERPGRGRPKSKPVARERQKRNLRTR